MKLELHTAEWESGICTLLGWSMNLWKRLDHAAAVAAVPVQGAGTQEFTKLMQRYFKKVARLRVEASRSMSREFYAIGLGRKPPS